MEKPNAADREIPKNGQKAQTANGMTELRETKPKPFPVKKAVWRTLALFGVYAALFEKPTVFAGLCAAGPFLVGLLLPPDKTRRQVWGTVGLLSVIATPLAIMLLRHFRSSGMTLLPPWLFGTLTIAVDTATQKRTVERRKMLKLIGVMLVLFSCFWA